MSASPVDKLRRIAQHWLACRRTDHAEVALREILSAEPQDLFALTQLSGLLTDQNETQEAEELARAAIRGYPDHAAGYGALARAAQRRNDHAVAISAATNAVRIQPNSFYLGLLSSVFYSARRISEARGAAAECLRLEPTDLNALAISALTSLALRDFAQAEGCARVLLQHGPVEGFCLTMAATVFREIGLRAEGMRLLRTLVEHEPNNPRAHEAIALACWNRGDIATARKHFREALRIDPRMERVRQILRLHSKTRAQDMPEGWVYTRYIDRYDAQGRRTRTIIEERRRPPTE